MPDFVDNTAGYSEVTGTADYLMTTTGTGLHLRLDQALVDAQEVAYYAVGTSNGVDAFESGVAAWDDSENTLVVGTITNSSNGGGKISWDAGDKTIYIVANSATMVNDDDPRLVSEDVDDLTPGTAPTGVEKFATTQDGDPVYLTAQQIAGNPIRQQLGHSKKVNASFSNFTKLSKTFSAPDGSSGVAAGLEPFLCYASGTGSGVVNLQLVTPVSSLAVSTGTTTTGRACLEHIEYPILYLPTLYDRDYRKTISMGGVLPTGGQDYTLQCGFSSNAPEIATLGSGLGVFFELKTGDTNWHAVWISHTSGAANYRRVDTGVPATIAGIYTLRVHLVSHPTTGAERKALFYIDGELVATIRENDGGHTSMAAGTRLSMLEVIKKAAGTTQASISVLAHYSEIENAAPPVGLDV
jgi:hypothetical protein